MADAILYCDRCGRMINPAEIRGGRAVLGPTAAVCASCAEALSPEERAKLRAAGSPRPRPSPAPRASSSRLSSIRDSTRKSARLAEAAPPEGTSKFPVILIGGVVAGLLVGVTVAVLMVGKTKPAAKPKPLPVAPAGPAKTVVPVAPVWGAAEATQPVEQKPQIEPEVPPVEPLSPARKRLIEIRAMWDPSLTRYKEIKAALEGFLVEFGSTSEAAEAKTLLAELSSKTLSIGDAAFWEASESAYALVAQAKFDEAASVLKALRMREDLSGWLRERGESRIAALLGKIEEQRSAAVERATAREREMAKAKFFADLKEAGRRGLEEAKALLERERPNLAELGLTEVAARFASYIREAQTVESLVLDGLKSARGMVRVQWQGRPCSGKVVAVDKGVLSLKPAVGAQMDIPLAEISPEELVQASEILRLGAVPAVKVARYLLARGDLDGARKLARDATGEGAQALRDDIEAYSLAIAKASEPPEKGDSIEIAMLGAAPPPPSEKQRHPLDADPDLVGYWAFDEGQGKISRDLSGKSVDASIKGAVWTEGRFGAGLYVDNGSYAEISGSERLDKLQEGDYTIAAWFKPEATPSGTGNANDSAYGIVVKAGWHTGIHYNSDGRFVAEYWLTPDRNVYISSKPFPPGNFYHVVAVVNKAEGTHRLYVNGVLEASATFDPKATPRNYGNEAWRVGIARPGATQWGWPAKGIVDEVRLYARALKPEEISSLAKYEVSAGPVKVAAAPVAPAAYRQGLAGEYFEGTDRNPAKLKLRRIDPTIDFDWRGGSPAPELPADNFSVRWTGEIKVPADGRYEFTVKRDNGFALWIDGKPVIQKLDGGFGVEVGSVELKAGWVPIRVEYYEDLGDASVKLSWSGPGGASGTIPAEAFRVASAEGMPAGLAAERTADSTPAETKPEVRQVAVEWPREPLPGETGLPGQWASGLICEILQGDGKTPIAARIDPQIDFLLGHAIPELSKHPGPYKIRWTGWLLLPIDGRYSFEGESGEEALEASLGGRQLFSIQKGKSRSQEREYKAGLYPLVVNLDASKRWWVIAALRWQMPGGSMTAIPPEYFYHEVPQPGRYGPPAQTVQGLWAEYFSDENFSKKVAEGPIDTLDLFFGALPPCQSCPKGRFSMKIRGYLLIFQDKEYGFELTSDGPAKLTIGGTVVVDNLSGRGPTSLTSTVKLDRGLQELTVDYIHRTGDARLKVRWGMWQPNNLGDLGATFLFRKATRPRLADRAGLAPGLFANIFPSEKPGTARAVQARYDPALIFNWGGRRPVESLSGKAFSGVWNGMLIVPENGQYTFRVKLQGMVQLSVGGKTLINKAESKEDWAEATTQLQAGKVPVVLTYSLKEGNSILEAYWSGPSFGFRRLGGDAVAHTAKRLPIAELAKEPEPQEVAAKPTERVPAPLPGEKPPEKPPEGNLVVNGSFEEQSEDGRFAARWTAHQWGPANAPHIVRIDRGNAHTGDKALLVQAQSDGALPGAFTTLTAALTPAKYEIRFFACADIGKSATVLANLAGRDAGSVTVGEDWKKVSFVVEIPEKKLGATLRLWTSTPRVKVWFDDVEVEAVK